MNLHFKFEFPRSQDDADLTNNIQKYYNKTYKDTISKPQPLKKSSELNK